ncbi:unnamed protein product [Echinostoma caproni]|uniref:Peptidase_S9_N domain-containing protein n=1 Tax=Echinostoma caproni TaxID=27848 RepID=A0A183AGC7_9TREM|nr:unnamed protein product [Echinostoma caproni]
MVRNVSEFRLIPIIHTWDARYTYVTNQKNKFVFLTNSNAPMNRLIEIDLDNNNWSKWKELVPHDPESKLEHAVSAGPQYLVVNRLKEGKVRASGKTEVEILRNVLNRSEGLRCMNAMRAFHINFSPT